MLRANQTSGVPHAGRDARQAKSKPFWRTRQASMLAAFERNPSPMWYVGDNARSMTATGERANGVKSLDFVPGRT